MPKAFQALDAVGQGVEAVQIFLAEDLVAACNNIPTIFNFEIFIILAFVQ